MKEEVKRIIKKQERKAADETTGRDDGEYKEDESNESEEGI